MTDPHSKMDGSNQNGPPPSGVSATTAASEPTLPTLGLSEIPASDRTTLCKLCFLPSDPDRLGVLYQYVVDPVNEIYCAHFFCLLFSSGLDQNGDEEEEIMGFRTQDILKEWRRGQRLKVSKIIWRLLVTCYEDFPAVLVLLLQKTVRDCGLPGQVQEDLPLDLWIGKWRLASI